MKNKKIVEKLPIAMPFLLFSIILIVIGNNIILSYGPEYNSLGWGLFGTGMILAFFGVNIQTSAELQEKINLLDQKIISKYSLGIYQWVMVLAGISSSALVYIYSGNGWIMRNTFTAVSLWLIGITLTCIALIDKQKINLSIEKKEWMWGIGLSVVAIILRLYKLEDYPIVLTSDEASMGLHSLLFSKGEIDNILSTGWFSFPSLFYFLQGISITIFGQTIFAIRFLSALFSGLTVGLTFFLGQKLYNFSVGVFAGILLLTQHFFFHFSRLGLNNVIDSFWFVWVLFLLLKAYKEKNRNLYILLGISLGLSQYFYASARMIIIIIIGWVIWKITIEKDYINQNQNIVAMILAYMVIIIPLGTYYFNNTSDFFDPYVRVKITENWLETESQNLGISKQQVLVQLPIKTLKIFTLESPSHWYFPKTGLIRGLSIPFLYLGLLFFIIEKWSANKLLLLLWFGVIFIPGTFSLPVISSQRFVAIAPLLVILIALGINKIVSLFTSTFPNQSKNLFYASIAFCGFLSFSDINFYINDYSPSSMIHGSNEVVANHLAGYINKNIEESDNVQVAFWGLPRMGYHSVLSLPYLAPQVEGLTMNGPLGSADNSLITADEIVFILLPEHESLQAEILDAYPGGNFTPIFSDRDLFLYWQYHYK